MCSISGIQGLKPTIEIIKYTKKIAIANKEAIVCGWDLITKNLNKYKTKFIPVDSEHFSIWYALQGIEKNLIDHAIHIENLLYKHYLKSNETEQHYNNFYNKVSSIYKRIPKEDNFKFNITNAKGFIFIIGTPLILAHVEPLVSLLKQKSQSFNKEKNISVVVLVGSCNKFEKVFLDLGVNVIFFNDKLLY